MDTPEIKKSSRKDKKYMVRVGGKLIHFGSSAHKQYRDSTPLKLYSHLDHNDQKKRENYFKRHGQTTDKMSAKWWSHNYLWK